MLDFFDFLEWVRTGELNVTLIAMVLGGLILPCFAFVPRHASPRYSVFKGRRDIEITHLAESPTAKNRFNRDIALGETSDGQEVLVDFRHMEIRQLDRVSVIVLCTSEPPVECIGQAPLPVLAR